MKAIQTNKQKNHKHDLKLILSMMQSSHADRFLLPDKASLLSSVGII